MVQHPGDAASEGGRSYDEDIIRTRDVLHRTLVAQAEINGATAPSSAQVAQMMDDAAIRYLQSAGVPNDKPLPIQRRLVASLVLPKSLDSENVRRALVYAVVTKWKP